MCNSFEQTVLTFCSQLLYRYGIKLHYNTLHYITVCSKVRPCKSDKVSQTFVLRCCALHCCILWWVSVTYSMRVTAQWYTSNAPRDAVCTQFDRCTDSTGSPAGRRLLLATMMPCAEHGGMYSKADRPAVCFAAPSVYDVWWVECRWLLEIWCVMLPRSSASSLPLAVVVEVLDSSVLLVLRQLKSVASTASEFTFESPTSARTPTVKVRPISTLSILSTYNEVVQWASEMVIAIQNNTPYQLKCIC